MSWYMLFHLIYAVTLYVKYDAAALSQTYFNFAIFLNLSAIGEWKCWYYLLKPVYINIPVLVSSILFQCNCLKFEGHWNHQHRCSHAVMQVEAAEWNSQLKLAKQVSTNLACCVHISWCLEQFFNNWCVTHLACNPQWCCTILHKSIKQTTFIRLKLIQLSTRQWIIKSFINFYSVIACMTSNYVVNPHCWTLRLKMPQRW